MKTKISILLILLTCFGAAQAITVGTYSCPPFSMHEDGEDIGLVTEVVKKILADAGIKNYQFFEYPLARGLAELDSKRIDIFYPYIASEDTKNNKYISIGPIARYQLALFVRKGQNQSASIDSLREKVLGIERGSIAEALLDNQGMHLEQASKQISCLTMVLAERVTACALGTLPGRYTAAINNIYDQIDYTDTNLYAEVYVLLGTNLSQEMIDKITASYAKLKAENYFVLRQKEYETKFNIFIKSLS